MRIVTRLKGINKVRRVTASGAVRFDYYHRATNTRLPDDPQSDEFLAAYREIEAGLTRKPFDTIEALIDKFKDSGDWRKLRDSTREIMTINLRAVSAKFGDMPVDGLKDRRCRSIFLAWHDELSEHHPRAADAKLAALQRVIGWAHDRAIAPAHPIEHFRRAYSSNRVEKIWLPEHVAAFEAVASPELALALSLALHTGQRQGDLLRMTWKAFDGKGLALVQSKTRARVYIPCTAALLVALRAAKDAGSGAFVLTAPNGRPWSAEALKRAWRVAFKTSGITEDLHFNDLRGTAVTMLAEAGCTVPEIAAITGHSLTSATRILEVYLSKTKALATAAIVKLNEHARNRAATGSATNA